MLCMISVKTSRKPAFYKGLTSFLSFIARFAGENLFLGLAITDFETFFYENYLYFSCIKEYFL